MLITTGMSAPPIGMMISTPSANAIAVINANGVHALSAARKNAVPKPIIASPSARFSQCCPGNTTGAEEKRRKRLPSPASLPKAITEPENVIAPTKVPMNSSSLLPLGSGSATPNAAGLLTAPIAISTAAMPTSECIAATSSGICVICTRRATSAPSVPPTSMASTIKSRRPFQISATVKTTASAIPAMPSTLPRRALVGAERPFSARMKQTEATRYHSVSWFALISSS